MSNRDYIFAALALWTLWGLSWLVAARWAGRPVGHADARSYGGQLAIAFLGFGLLFFGRPVPPHPLWLVPAWLGLGAIGLVAAGFTFAWWARIQLGDLWSAAIVRRDGHRIVDSGPYAIVRHPIYTALIAGAAGFAIVKATPLALVGVGLIALGFGLKARTEEDFLGSEFGRDAYASYRQRVPMLIPFLRRP